MPMMAERLTAAADKLRQARAEHKPAPVLLALARRGFAAAGAVSSLLDQHSGRHRDAYPVGNQMAEQAIGILDDTLGEHLIRRWGEPFAGEDLHHVAQAASMEMWTADPEHEPVARAMTALGDLLRETLTNLAGDDSLPPELRRAARPHGRSGPRDLGALRGRFRWLVTPNRPEPRNGPLPGERPGNWPSTCAASVRTTATSRSSSGTCAPSWALRWPGRPRSCRTCRPRTRSAAGTRPCGRRAAPATSS